MRKTLWAVARVLAACARDLSLPDPRVQGPGSISGGGSIATDLDGRPGKNGAEGDIGADAH